MAELYSNNSSSKYIRKINGQQKLINFYVRTGTSRRAGNLKKSTFRSAILVKVVVSTTYLLQILINNIVSIARSIQITRFSSLNVIFCENNYQLSSETFFLGNIDLKTDSGTAVAAMLCSIVPVYYVEKHV